MFLAATAVQGQINISGKVFGGARQANVGGSTVVNVGADNCDVIINAVYGGNDISGTIGHTTSSVPAILDIDKVTKYSIDNTYSSFVHTNKESNGYHIFIGSIFGGGFGDYYYEKQVLAGNVIKYNVYDKDDHSKLIAELVGNLPELAKAYLELCGGTFGYAYGGGDNATVTEAVDICIANESTPWKLMGDDDEVNTDDDIISDPDLQKMKINTEYFDQTGKYHFSRVFGGNNKAEMAIRPTWHLDEGSIENLYSGGNEGPMTHVQGLLLEIMADSKIKVQNVYGGCRKADVHPLSAGTIKDNTWVTATTPMIQLRDGNGQKIYNFPDGLSARLLIRGGQIHNVYGGNDVTGRVYGGNALGIYTSVSGNVYGGGNGSYPYTDNVKLANDLHWGDFYYDVNELLGKPKGYDFNGLESAQALNLFRPNAEQVSLRLLGKSEGEGENKVETPTIISSVYVGGNSATLKNDNEDYMVNLKVGSYVYADNVFLGNNGVDMINEDLLAQYAGTVTEKDSEGKSQTYDYSRMDLTVPIQFDEYMQGAAMSLKANVLFDGEDKTDVDTYEEYTAYFGSLFCGGNVGSMTNPGKNTINFNHKIIIFDKLVGGCNNANVPAGAHNAAYNGGLLGHVDGTKLELNLSGLKIQPKRWKLKQNAGNYYKDAEGNYVKDAEKVLEWNTYSAATDEPVPPVTKIEYDQKKDEEGKPTGEYENYETSDNADLDRRLKGGNIYGGCYNSGHVDGDVVINLNSSIMDRKGQLSMFDEVEQNEGEAILYENDSYKITKRNSGVLLDEQGMDVLGTALNVFGGGFGENSEIWGSTTINLKSGYVFQIFGGGEKGVIGRSIQDGESDSGGERCVFNGKTYTYNEKYSCYVNVRGNADGVYRGHDKDTPDMAEAEFIYGGAFFAPVAGNTVINLGKGRVFNTFAGSCNADILGHTETYVGRQVNDEESENKYSDGFPWVRDHIYGGNDLGGRIKGKKNFYNQVSDQSQSMVYNPLEKTTPDVTDASAYIEYREGRVDYIFGGCYGVYDYTNTHYKDYSFTRTPVYDSQGKITGYNYTNDGSTKDNVGKAKPGFIKPRLDNAFINFKPNNNTSNAVTRVYGAGQGYSMDSDRDVMQNRSYILIDIQHNPTNYENMVVFGAGDYCGLGMSTDYYTELNGYVADKDNGITYDAAKNNTSKVTAAAVIDLVHGQVRNVYGGSYNEGITRRTIVNVPTGSTILVNHLFGGAFGVDTYKPCDVYEANVNYKSDKAKVTGGAIYGGNNNERRTLYGKVNIYSTVWQDEANGRMAKIFAAGLGANTWSEYTEVNLENNAKVYEVYGGGEKGKIYNAESIQKYKDNKPTDVWPQGSERAGETFTDEDWVAAWKLGKGYDPDDAETKYYENEKTNLSNSLVREAEMDDRYNPDHEKYAYTEDTEKKFLKKYNTNVIIKEGAYVDNYVYGGGLGVDAVVAGTTYVALLGGEVNKDIYGSGTSGSVMDKHNTRQFIASANVYVEGGFVRNVFGGGWRGSVGYAKHKDGDPILFEDEEVKDDNGNVIRYSLPNYGANYANDILGETHVVVGKREGGTYLAGIPSVRRNVYGGGEGGAIYGTAYVTINNGYIGYRYNPSGTDNTTTKDFDEHYEAENDADVPGDNLIKKRGGNVFGGGYVANSYVDYTDVNMYGGIIRGGLYGGGEIGPIGRGTVNATVNSVINTAIQAGTVTTPTPFTNANAVIYKGGETHVDLYGGHVMGDVFGGGRGYDNWGNEGWMSPSELKTMDRSSKGFVFGSTETHIHGGEVGTKSGALAGHGNVFGGGNEGYVYSATGMKVGEKENDENLVNGMPASGGGFYYDSYTTNGSGQVTSLGNLTLDCTVDITPFCEVTGASVEIGGETYYKGQFVKVDDLNKLKNRNSDGRWNQLDTYGVIIHNAVFAGGNITEGSDIISASTVTVYGNAAASLRDVYNYDLITLGSDDIGGLYGDGNLTLVDGFRELHIDNYGTDKYSLADALDVTDYDNLTDRQKAYYKLKYVLIDQTQSHTYRYYESQFLHTYEYTDDDGSHSVTYRKGQKISYTDYDAIKNRYDEHAEHPDEEYKNWIQGTKTYPKDDQIEEGEHSLMDPDEQALWKLWGVCSIYAGRPMNTIQRADMCGVFGSRMVLKGAQDRVPNVIDYTDYTINRVDEVSLNKRVSTAGDTDDVNKEHGNYFGIYNVVNYLGNLTSDVFFDAVRQTDTNITDIKADGETTYYQWKSDHPVSKYRNNGISHNMVALASGVYLEIKREEGETTGTDEWGFITGVVELDLINVLQGMGGGYVYARNEHGKKTWHGNPENTSDKGESEFPAGQGVYWNKVTLLNYNLEARTYRRFSYDHTTTQERIETSGNFVHNTKQIVDDCYPKGGVYDDGYQQSPAHYWFVKGSVYVYEQYISAYTGAANAYAEKVDMPLTISAASHGKLTLREVQPNYYAYYDKNGNVLGSMVGEQQADTVYVANNIAYKLNEPISYWNYRLLTEDEKNRFVKETYVTIADCSYTDKKTNKTTEYPAGSVLLPNEYNALLENCIKGKIREEDTDNVEYVLDGDGKKLAFTYVFRPSNNLSHETGFVLTYDVNNPGVWNKYYTKKNLTAETISGVEHPVKLDTENYSKKNEDNTYVYTQDKYWAGPTYQLKSDAIVGDGAVFGQHLIKYGSIVFASDKDTYEAEVVGHLTEAEQAKQAEVELAYVVKSDVDVRDNGVVVKQLKANTPIILSEYTAEQLSSLEDYIEPASVCTSLLQFSVNDFVYAGKILTSADIATIESKVIAMMEYENDDESVPVDERKTATEKADKYLEDYISNTAYYCKSVDGGLYGGYYLEKGKAYPALHSFCDMSEEDRNKLIFNYDAFDLLIDPTFDGRDEGNYGDKPQYDGYDPLYKNVEVGDPNYEKAQYVGCTPLNPKIYSKEQAIDYEAEFIGDENSIVGDDNVKYIEYQPKTGSKVKIKVGDPWLSRTDYEQIPNEKRYYSPIIVTSPGKYYVVKEPFMRGDIPYTTGQVIDEELYLSLPDQEQKNVDTYRFTTAHTQQAKNDNDQRLYKDASGNITTAATDGQGHDNTPVYVEKNYYYCRASYPINEKGAGVSVKTQSGVYTYTEGTENSTPTSEEIYDVNATVPQGIIINKDVYKNLPNFQTGFAIHGTAPTETSTLYVSSESDIFSLSKEKIITVIYLYEYEESDESGLNVTPVSERHIVNIHINFKSGVPQIGKLKKPDIVIPGTTIGLEIPTVTEGAYRVTNSGWEIFAEQTDAQTGTNGKEYYNNITPVYLYQDNYWIAYYAETYLGRTYSTPVQFNVANYHDLQRVMEAKEHHYYIDHEKLFAKSIRPKIYINDYTSGSQNGADLLKDLYDLSLVPLTYDSNGNKEAISGGGRLDGHVPLESRVQGGTGLEFFLRTDIDKSIDNPDYDPEEEDSPERISDPSWEPIAGKNSGGEYPNCFSGVLHGDGHTVSGLGKSLFGKLCGSVYNLGVTGSFTSAGVADTGGGYVENCWVKSTATELPADASKVYAVFGDPDDDDGYQVVNSYFWDGNAALYNTSTNSDGVTTSGGDRGTARQMTEQEFYNGTVAYNLNGFYLYKRYCDEKVTSGKSYRYYTVDSDGTSLVLHKDDASGHYADDNAQWCSSGYGTIKYVEERFADGDYRYDLAGGNIPTTADVRSYTDTEDENKEKYYPIWPDDYIFFGQRLNYGYRDEVAHQEVPSFVVKEKGRLVTDNTGNRVYRAPAYFRSKEMGVAHFNPWANLSAHSKPKTITDTDWTWAYPNMTAIDFAGHNDIDVSDPYQLGLKGKLFYQPLLDDDGLVNLVCNDQTSNLLVYAPAKTSDSGYANAKTYDVLNGTEEEDSYFAEPAFAGNYDESDPYKRISIISAGSVHGHLVQAQLTNGKPTATNDHLLVDKQDFNCPIAYAFADNYRMWYQRVPDRYVESDNSGWDAVSLPFKVELVTTQTKGEITHFYDGLNTDESSNNKGHEYWLREFAEGGSKKSDDDKVYIANMTYPAANSYDGEKTYTNDFLWDYYYSYNSHYDKNLDEYQDEYYKMKDGNYVQKYKNYPRLAPATPYIIGFPGSRYYEFDLSGQFEASTTKLDNPGDLPPQTITFASAPSDKSDDNLFLTIGVSDDECGGVTKEVVDKNFTFKPSYLNNPKVTDGMHAFPLNSNGDSFVEDASTVAPNDVRKANVKAFRPYFEAAPASSPAPAITRSIIFSNNSSQLGGDEQESKDNVAESMEFYAKKHKIVVTSHMLTTTDVAIFNVSGMCIASFDIEPGETVETRVNNSGVYIIRAAGGHYTKKVSVK